MKDVNIICGTDEIISKPLQAYDDRVINFLSDLSRALMNIRAWPDVVSLGFWCRRANLEKMRSTCHEYNFRIGRGLCFHIAPSNIPVNFAFSYMFGLISGCANIIRVPSKNFEQVNIILDIVNEKLKSYPEIYSRTQFIKYPSDNNNITAEYSLKSDARLIWGGDATIKNIRALESKPRCIDICFADRYSIALINSEAVMNANEADLKRLAENFYNDTFLIDQNACSSPNIIFWLNDNENKPARLKFWQAVHEYSDSKYKIQASIGVNKFSKACEDAINFDIQSTRYNNKNLIWLAELKNLDENLDTFRGSSGYFYEYVLNNYDELFKIINSKYQTLTYYGIDADELQSLIIKNNLTGIDRITPIGRALDIGIIWDGFDIVRTLSRIVNKE